MTEDHGIMYTVEEEDDEEETITLDFENKAIYQKEEGLIIGENLKEQWDQSMKDAFSITPGSVVPLDDGIPAITTGTWQSIYPPPAPSTTTVTTLPFITPASTGGIRMDASKVQTATVAPPPEPSFQLELQDLLLNKITSKGVASLLSKLNKLGDELDQLPEKKRMGKLSDMMQHDIYELTHKRRAELKQSFSGGQVRYDRIPKWAREYVKDYIGEMIHGLAILTEDDK